jgi:hypothetical protein
MPLGAAWRFRERVHAEPVKASLRQMQVRSKPVLARRVCGFNLFNPIVVIEMRLTLTGISAAAGYLFQVRQGEGRAHNALGDVKDAIRRVGE